MVVPGGGFISNVDGLRGISRGNEIHKLGYSVLVISYPIGKQLGETEHEKQGQAAVRELVQVIRYLKEHEQELSVDMDDYAIFGFSAGGMIDYGIFLRKLRGLLSQSKTAETESDFPDVWSGLECESA